MKKQRVKKKEEEQQKKRCVKKVFFSVKCFLCVSGEEKQFPIKRLLHRFSLSHKRKASYLAN